MTPEEAFYKCRNDNKRDKELEPIIIKSPMYAYAYAKHIIKGRWIEAEEIISTDSECAYYYAFYIIKGKLPENMHNAMLIHADGCAKFYFNLIK
jgi:hypothetical protein